MKKKISVLLLAVCMLIMVFPMTSYANSDNSKLEPAVDNIKSIQAYTDFCFYGQKLTKVEIKYDGKVDLSGVTPDTYKLLDRGYANPDFAEITIDSVEVNGKTVTLNITQDTEALPGNALIYSGDNATGSRMKNPMGVYATGPWYRDVEGVIHFGNVDTDSYKANTTREGYQTRECLELKLYHAGETETDAACLANEDGSYNRDGLWLPTIDANYGKHGFQTFEELGINVPTTATDGEKYVRGFAYFPKGYDKERADKYPMIITITGNGTSFWLLPDGTNNFGTGLNFDGSGFRWMDSDAIVLNIHDRSHTGGTDYKFWVDDYNVIQYFIQNYNADPEAVTLTGNSRGTMAIGRIYREYPGIANKLIINNGSIGSGWTDADWQNAAQYGTGIWAFDGEQDTNNIDAYKKAISFYKAAGWSDEWIAENIRITGFPTELYYYWGETDHSTTKMTYWYFFDNPYYGPDAKIVDGELVYNTKLNEGDTYQLNGRLTGGVYNKAGFDYVIYSETLRDWVLSKSKTERKQGIVSTSAVTAPGPFGQKLKGIILEYSGKVDIEALDLESFELRAEVNNLTKEYSTSTINRVYTNCVPELLDEGADAVAGKYVIIETDDYDKVGLVVDNFYYKDGDVTRSMAVRKDLNGSYNISVMQLDAVYEKNGKLLAAPSERPMTIAQENISYPVIQDFQYTFLTDSQAEEALEKFTFGNNNFEYSISSNTTKSNHKDLTEEDLLGDLNQATLSNLGVHLWVHLPENYDPQKEYPLIMYAHGTGESLSSVPLADNTYISNRGIHFAVNLAASTWAMSGDYGYEDVIVVAPQYYNGNSPRADKYERDDAFRAAFCHALDYYSVDRDHVYVTGTSQGAGRTTALLRDCAEYITGVIIQNGGYSSALSREADGVEVHEDIFEYAASQNVALWFFQGVDDRISPPYVAENMHNAFKNLYEEIGKDEVWIEDNLRITYLPMKLYLDMNESSAHSSIKPTYEWYANYDHDSYYGNYSDAEDSLGIYLDDKYGNNDPGGYKGMMDWVLSKSKSSR